MGFELMERLKTLVAFTALESLQCRWALRSLCLFGLCCIIRSFPHTGHIRWGQSSEQGLGPVKQALLVEYITISLCLPADGTLKTLREGFLWVGQLILTQEGLIRQSVHMTSGPEDASQMPKRLDIQQTAPFGSDTHGLEAIQL